MIEHPDPGQTGKKRSPASFGERGAGGTTEAPAEYQAFASGQGGSHSALDDLREAARALHGLTLPDWMRERIIAGLVKDHAPAIARELLTGEGIKK